MEDSGYSEKDTPRFNLGISYIQRIDYILTQVMNTRMSGSAQQWNDFLCSLYMEIKAKLNEKEVKSAKGMQSEINLQFRRLKKRKMSISPNLYMALMSYEEFLRGKLHHFGLLMPMEGVDEHDMT